MFRLSIISAVILLAGFPATAHPSYGIFINAQGDIIFTDLLHQEGCVLQLSAAGELTTLVHHQHVHWITPARDGGFWGTNHEYLPRTESNRNTLWKWHEGVMEIVIPPVEDMAAFSGVNFVVNAAGDIIFNHERRIYIRSADGPPQLYSDFTFRRITSLQRDDADNVYVAENIFGHGSIYRIDPEGHTELVIDSLRALEPADPPFPEPRFDLLFGMFAAKDQSLYIANSGSRRITRITPDGTVAHIYHSDAPWYPVGYTQRDGKRCVLEMAYQPGRGNFGPRVVDISSGSPKVLVNVDEPAQRGSAEQLTCSPSQLLILQIAASLGIIILIFAGIYSRLNRNKPSL